MTEPTAADLERARQIISQASAEHRGWDWQLTEIARALAAARAEGTEELVRHVDALMDAMAAERPLREPETSAEVLTAWDALTDWLDADLPRRP